MFKSKNVDIEIMESMQKNLIANASEEVQTINKIAKAVDYIQSAANIFNKANMIVEAEILTKILEKFAKDAK